MPNFVFMRLIRLPPVGLAFGGEAQRFSANITKEVFNRAKSLGPSEIILE
jgi:hypothetical protein